MRRVSVSFVVAVVAAIVMGSVNGAAAESVSALPTVVPSPRQMAWTQADQPGWLEVSAIKAIVLPPECSSAAGGVEQFTARLRELGMNDADLPKLESQEGATPTSGAIHLGVTPNAGLEARVAALPVPEAEGYRLAVEADAVCILGQDLPGLYYGLMTLRQLVDAQGRIPRVAVSDWPDLPLRGTYVGGNAGLEARILQCAALKLNFMLFECGDFFYLDDVAKRTQWQEVFALCRKHFIEPVPELQSFGWGQYVLGAHPGAAEGVYVDKCRFEVKGGSVESADPPTPPDAAIVNAGFESTEGESIPGWASDRPSAEAGIDREGGHAGSGCLRLARAEEGTVRVWQDIEVNALGRYELSCFQKTQGIRHGKAYIEIYGLDAQGNLGSWLCLCPPIESDRDWQRMAVAFGSGDYTRLRIYTRLQDATGTAWFDDIAVTGVAGLNPFANVLITPSAPLIVQDESGTITYEEGKDYRVNRAPVVFPYETGSPLGIEIVEGGRIAKDAAVLLSYHQAPQGSFTCCPSEPVYQESMRAAIHKVVESLRPKYLHIGHDEPRVLNRDLRCTSRHLSNSELFADEVKNMRAYALEADPAIRVMMWADAVNPYHNGPSLNMNDAAALIPKDVIQCLWWYEWPDPESRLENSTNFFVDLGFDVTGSPWFKHENVHQWAKTLLEKRKSSPHVLGEIYTSWSDTSEDPWQALETAAQYAWSVDKIPLEDFLKRQPS